jgi:tetratricopeptide (TPR) repeat protein
MPGYAAPARKLSWLVLEKVPLLLLSAGSAYMTMKAQWANGTLGGLNQYPFSVRLGGSIVGYVRYLWHALWPQNLSFFYPHAHGAPPALQIVGSLLLLLLITAIAIAARGHRYFAVGWLWFLGTLVPMIELVQVGNHAMADRYGYLPYVGLFIAICWGVAGLAESSRFLKVGVAAVTVAVLVILSFATRRQVNYWTDDLTLWTHSAEAVKNNAMAENMIGENLLREQDRDDAIAHFKAAAGMDPEFPFPQLHIGVYDEAHGHPREALVHFQRVIELTDKVPDSMAAIRTNAFANMSFVYNQLGDYANQQKYLTLAEQQHESEENESNGPQ